MDIITWQNGKQYDRAKGNRCFGVPQPIPYWYAFLEPPYGVPYLTSDFIKFNDVLFPFKDETEVYRWNDDFSNYFDDGKEWWGDRTLVSI